MRSSSSSVTISDNSRRGSPYESYSEDIKGGVLLVSVDFDSCLAGAAFVRRYQEIASLRESDYDRYIEEYKKILREIHPELIKNILAHAATAEEVIVMIGSNRQLPDIDRSNARNNGNGSCFDGIPILTDLLQELMPAKRVSHQPYTLGDSIFNQTDGYTATVTQAQSNPQAAWSQSTELATVFADVIKDKKYFLMYQQAMMICAGRPNAKVDMVFYDDLPEVLTVAAHQFAEKGVNNAMPSNFGSITLNSYEDNKILSVPDNILQFIDHGESGEIPEYLVRDSLRLIDVLREAASQWLELSSQYTDQIAFLQVRTAELNKLKTSAQAESSAKIEVLITKHLSADKAFVSLLEQTILVVNDSLVVDEKGAELAASFQKAVEQKDQAAIAGFLMNSSFQGMIKGAGASEQVSSFAKLYRQSVKQIRAENSGIIAGYKKDLEVIDREYQINSDLLKCFSLAKKEHLAALDEARAYFVSGQVITKQSVMPHIGAIKKATDFLDAKTLAHMSVLRDAVGVNDNSAKINVSDVCGKMLGIAERTDQDLVREENNRLHHVKSVVVNGEFPVHLCATIFSKPRSHNEFVAACMSKQLWNTEVEAPNIAKLESIFYQSLAVENLRTLLSQSPFKEKIAAKKCSEGLKLIHQLLETNTDKLDPHALLNQCKQIALEKNDPKAARKEKLKQGQLNDGVKGLRRSKSRDPDNIALYKMLAATNTDSPVTLLNLSTIHSYLNKNGSKYAFVQPSSHPPLVAGSSQIGIFQSTAKETDSKNDTGKTRKFKLGGNRGQ